EVDVASAAVNGGEMEHDVDVGDRTLRSAGLEQVLLDKGDDAGVDVGLDVDELAARKVVNDTNAAGTLLDEEIDEVGADEGRASGDKDALKRPTHGHSVLA